MGDGIALNKRLSAVFFPPPAVGRRGDEYLRPDSFRLNIINLFVWDVCWNGLHSFLPIWIPFHRLHRRHRPYCLLSWGVWLALCVRVVESLEKVTLFTLPSLHLDENCVGWNAPSGFLIRWRRMAFQKCFQSRELYIHIKFFSNGFRCVTGKRSTT